MRWVDRHLLRNTHGRTNDFHRYAHEHGVACIGLDMPGHGRSDGLFMYIDGWFNFVGWAEEFCDTVVPEKVKEWSNRLGGKRLKVFGQGVSLGGGVWSAQSNPPAAVEFSYRPIFGL